MARSEYVEQRLAEIARSYPMRLRRVLQATTKPRPVRKPLPIQPPRSETIGAIGTMYVRKIRTKNAEPQATWFDVAKAYCDGWADAESIAPKRGALPQGDNS